LVVIPRRTQPARRHAQVLEPDAFDATTVSGIQGRYSPWFQLPRRGNPERVFGFDSVLVVVGGLLAVILLVAGVAYLRWLSARRGRSGGKRA
jgi:hypothetical protein